MPRTTYYNGDTIDGHSLPDGWTLRVSIERDDYMGEPWKEHDGHGEVSEWTRRDKRPGEWVLCTDRGSSRFYDAQVSQRIALRDGWGMGPEWEADFARQHGRAPTRREIAAAAVRADYEHLRGWCNDEWEWVCIGVVLTDADGEEVASDYVGGVESSDPEYVASEIQRMADALVADHADTIAAAFASEEDTHA